MVPDETRVSNKRLAVIAAGLWLIAIALAGFLLLTGGNAGAERSAVSDSAPSHATSGGIAEASTSATKRATALSPATLPPTPQPPTSLPSATTSLVTTTTLPETTTTTIRPPLSVAAGGDVMGDRGVGDFVDGKGGPALFAQVRPYLESAQLSFINLECAVSDKGVRNPVKEYTFRAPTGLTEGLVSAGIDVVSLANNHVLDYGRSALLDTIRRLDDAGVAHAGAGKNLAAAAAPAIMATPAGTVAVLAASEIVPGGFGASAEQPGTNPAVPDYKRLLSAIKSAASRTDFVIVSMHWGTEYTTSPNAGQRELAHAMIDAGADLVIGHHPHVIQGMELYKDKLIAYSLGDFVFDHHSRRETGEAFVLQVTLAQKGAPYVEAIPVYLDEETGAPSRVTGDEADVILGRLVKLSAGLGLRLLRGEDTAWLPNIPGSPYGTWF